jgi:macrodomain Ter protein organizer (MatP/YcbG family)
MKKRKLIDLDTQVIKRLSHLAVEAGLSLKKFIEIKLSELK